MLITNPIPNKKVIILCVFNDINIKTIPNILGMRGPNKIDSKLDSAFTLTILTVNLFASIYP